MRRIGWVAVGVVAVLVILLGTMIMSGLDSKLTAQAAQIKALESKPAVVDTAAIAKEVAAQMPAAPEVDLDKLVDKLAAKMTPSTGQPSSGLAPAAGVTTTVLAPPTGYVWAWHGRQGLGNAKGFNVEYIVQYPEAYVGTLEWWTCIVGKCDEFGNDSLKGADPTGPTGRWYMDAEGVGAFPKASWLSVPGQFVCENDKTGCGGQKWQLTKSDVIPDGFDKLMEYGHEVLIPVYYDAGMQKQVPGVMVIRWLTTDDFNKLP